MKTIKIIDLLNKIANGEEVPKTIKYDYCEWFWCEACSIYETGEIERTNLYKHFGIEGSLNDEVEILDEEDEFEDIEIKEETIFKGLTINDSFEHLYEIQLKLWKNQKKIIERLKDE